MEHEWVQTGHMVVFQLIGLNFEIFLAVQNKSKLINP